MPLQTLHKSMFAYSFISKNDKLFLYFEKKNKLSGYPPSTLPSQRTLYQSFTINSNHLLMEQQTYYSFTFYSTLLLSARRFCDQLVMERETLLVIYYSFNFTFIRQEVLLLVGHGRGDFIGHSSFIQLYFYPLGGSVISWSQKRRLYQTLIIYSTLLLSARRFCDQLVIEEETLLVIDHLFIFTLIRQEVL